MTIKLTMEGLRALAKAPSQSPKTGAEIRQEAQALLQQARDLFEAVRDVPEARDVHDGLRILAATIGARIVVPRRKRSASYAASADYAALLKQVDTLVGSAVALVRGRLPERRDWIFQNAVSLFREGLSTLHRRLVPPVGRAHAQKAQATPAPLAATGTTA